MNIKVVTSATILIFKIEYTVINFNVFLQLF